MYGSRGAMYGSGGLSDGYDIIGSKRPRITDNSTPYFAVSTSATAAAYHHQYNYTTAATTTTAATFPVIRLRGLPFNCTETDIFKFFSGLEILDVLLVNKSGRFSGEAFVLFTRQIQADMALQKDRQNIGRRYVEVFKCKKQDYYNAVASEVKYEYGNGNGNGNGNGYGYENDDYLAPRSKRGEGKEKERMEYTEVLKMRGLPFSVRKSEIYEFFKGFKVVEGKVVIACRPDGKATGEAYVEFETVEEAKDAMVKDRKMIGSRYVELFPSTLDEARRAESRSRQ